MMANIESIHKEIESMEYEVKRKVLLAERLVDGLLVIYSRMNEIDKESI